MNYNKQHEDLIGGGVMGELIRSFNWTDNPLGPRTSWPQSLITSVNIVLQSPVPMVMLWGQEGIMIYNDAYSVFAGKRHPFLLGSTVLEGWPEVADFNRNVLDHVLDGKTLSYTDQQLTLFRNNVAEEVWMDLNYSPIPDESGKPGGVLAIVVETTQRVVAEEKQKQAEENLRQSEEHLRALITATSDLIYIMNADWSEMGLLEGRVFVSDTGKPDREWFEKNIPIKDKLIVRKAIDEAIRTKSVFQLEHRVVKADGSIGWTFSRAIPVMDKDGKLIKWFGAATDITERKKVEFTLKESEERFRSLADHSPMIVFIIEPNAEATISYWSRSWLNYTGQTFEQALGRSWDGIVHQDDVPTVLEIYVPAFHNKQPYSIPAIRLKRHDGEFRWHFFKGNPRYLPNGDFMGYVGVGIDIHEQKILQEQLESKNIQLLKINNDLDNFIYTASHDLKAPMSNIEGLLNGLKDKVLDDAEKMDEETALLLQLIQKSIDRFKTTILDLTEITKAQKGYEEDIHELSLSQMVEDIRLSIYDKIVESRASIYTDFSVVNTIKFSRKNLKSVLYNLISNSIKYRDKVKTPEIFIKTEKTKGYYILSVIDNGLGIGKHNHEKLFTMFKRFHDHVEGTGVGLYIVKRIVENAGGKIEVESEVNKGTTFKIFFPVPTIV